MPRTTPKQDAEGSKASFLSRPRFKTRNELIRKANSLIQRLRSLPHDLSTALDSSQITTPIMSGESSSQATSSPTIIFPSRKSKIPSISKSSSTSSSTRSEKDIFLEKIQSICPLPNYNYKSEEKISEKRCSAKDGLLLFPCDKDQVDSFKKTLSVFQQELSLSKECKYDEKHQCLTIPNPNNSTLIRLSARLGAVLQFDKDSFNITTNSYVDHVIGIAKFKNQLMKSVWEFYWEYYKDTHPDADIPADDLISMTAAPISLDSEWHAIECNNLEMLVNLLLFVRSEYPLFFDHLQFITAISQTPYANKLTKEDRDDLAKHSSNLETVTCKTELSSGHGNYNFRLFRKPVAMENSEPDSAKELEAKKTDNSRKRRNSELGELSGSRNIIFRVKNIDEDMGVITLSRERQSSVKRLRSNQ